MSDQIQRRLRPEEEELLRKREDLSSLRTELAELELELADLRRQIAVFEGRYLREVGTLYSELDQWKARIAELQATLNPSRHLQAEAESARAQAKQTYDAAHGVESEVPAYVPSPEVKRLFRDVAKAIHPDFSKDPAEQERRTRMMADANRAFAVGDSERLRQILAEYQPGPDSVEGEGIGAELVRIIRQISAAKARVSSIQQELAELRQSDLAALLKQSEEFALEGRDLLTELADSVRHRIQEVKKQYEALEPRED